MWFVAPESTIQISHLLIILLLVLDFWLFNMFRRDFHCSLLRPGSFGFSTSMSGPESALFRPSIWMTLTLTVFPRPRPRSPPTMGTLCCPLPCPVLSVRSQSPYRSRYPITWKQLLKSWLVLLQWEHTIFVSLPSMHPFHLAGVCAIRATTFRRSSTARATLLTCSSCTMIEQTRFKDGKGSVASRFDLAVS